jgi:hypothetical protein
MSNDKKANDKKDQKFTIPEQLMPKVREWQGKHKKVKYLDVEGKLVFFRMPTRQEMSASESMSVDESGNVDVYKKAEKMLVDTYLGGELALETILEDTEMYMAVADFVLYHLVQKKKVSWGNC